MRIEIGVPGSGTTVVLDVSDLTNKAVSERVIEALNVLKTAGDTWVEWSREHETPEQTEMRELMERNAELRKRAMKQENAQLEQMLKGGTEGISKLPRI